MLKKLLTSNLLMKLYIHTVLKNTALCFMLHRVAKHDSQRIFSNENMKVSPEFLEYFIVDAKKRGYNFISLDQLHYKLQNKLTLHKCLILTLDDGYADNYTNAYPIFKKHDIPFAIYLSSGFINREYFPWWYQLEYLLLQNNNFTWNNQIHNVLTIEDKDILFLEIRKVLLQLNTNEFENYFYELLQINNYQPSDEENLFLNWEQINVMNSSGLLTIGNHGHKHLHLNKLTAPQIEEELTVASNLIQSKTGSTAKHFCYPYGEINFDVINQLKNQFDTITTVEAGFITSKYTKLQAQIPRFFLTENLGIETIIKQLAISTRLTKRQKVY